MKSDSGGTHPRFDGPPVHVLELGSPQDSFKGMSSQVCSGDQNDTWLQIPCYSDAATDPSLFGNLVLDQQNVAEDVLRPGHILHSFHQDLLGHLTQGHKKPHDSAVLQDKPETLADNPVGL